MDTEEKRPLLSKFRHDIEYRKRWISLIIAFVATFYMMLQDSMYWIALWPYLSAVEPTVSENFFGYVIMAFNLASTLASPLYGYWANRIRKTKWPIITGMLVVILGNIMLAFAESVPTGKKWAILAARIVSGIGMGGYGALFAYISMASTMEERNFAVSIRSVVNSATFLLGPVIMIVFYPIGFPGLTLGPVHFNMYTAPAYMNIILGIIQIIMMLTLFQEYWVTVENQAAENDLSKLDWRAVATNLTTRFTILFCFTYDTTIGSPLTMVMFNWTKQTAVLYNGFIQLGDSLLLLTGNLLIGNVALRYFRERTLMVIGSVALLGYYVISFSYPTQPPLLDDAAIVSTDGNVSITNCEYIWCEYTTRINIVQYIAAFVSMTAAFLVAYVPNATLFTKVLGPIRQGTMQGIFAGAGQLAMTISPVVCSNLFESYGPRVTWAAGGVVATIGILMIVGNYKHLLPYGELRNEEGGSSKTGVYERLDDVEK